MVKQPPATGIPLGMPRSYLKEKKMEVHPKNPPSHNDFEKKITPAQPLPSLSTMKKTFPEPLN
jgi:hypothetical protein